VAKIEYDAATNLAGCAIGEPPLRASSGFNRGVPIELGFRKLGECCVRIFFSASLASRRLTAKQLDPALILFGKASVGLQRYSLQPECA
jgi:hypothetical protein